MSDVTRASALSPEAKQRLKERDEAITALFPSSDQAHIRELVKTGMNDMIGYKPDPDESEISIRPGSGTCCPEMKVVDGRCKSCGHVHDVALALSTKREHWLARVDTRAYDKKYGVCLTCGGKHEIFIYDSETGKPVDSEPCPACVRCCETCDNITMDDEGLTGHCVKHDIGVEFDYCCDEFEEREY